MRDINVARRRQPGVGRQFVPHIHLAAIVPGDVFEKIAARR
jgi:hypothetical protein